MEEEKIINIPVEDILPNRFQPRLAFDEKELTELSNSIIKYGVIQPIVLRQIGDKYEIIAGERRYKATVVAGLKTIPAIINNTDDNTSAEIALLENLQRKNLTVIEEAQSFKKLMNKGFTQEEIASKLGISQSSIANKIRLLNLPKKVQDALLYNKISERHARSLLSLDNTELQLDLLDKIIEGKLTVKQTEDEISKLLNKDNKEENIPEDIKKFLTEEPEKDKKKKNDISQFLGNIPNIVEIDNKESNIVKIDNNDRTIINPFQERFESSIKKIDEEIKDKEESFYDNIINNNIEKTKFNFIDLGTENESVDSPKIINNDVLPVENNSIFESQKTDEKLPKMISEVREFVNSLGNSHVVTTKELDFPDKYQIIVEIRKNEVNY